MTLSSGSYPPIRLSSYVDGTQNCQNLTLFSIHSCTLLSTCQLDKNIVDMTHYYKRVRRK